MKNYDPKWRIRGPQTPNGALTQPTGHIQTPGIHIVCLKQFFKGAKNRPNLSQIWIWRCGENELSKMK
jgi:hypothetical protein